MIGLLMEMIFRDADENKNIKNLIIHLNNGDIVTVKDTKRLSNVGLVGENIEISGGYYNTNKKETTSIIIPNNQVIAIEINKDNE